MTADGERIAKLESRLDRQGEILEEIREMLRDAVHRQSEADKRQADSDKKLAAYENQLKGARYIFSMIVAIAAFLGWNKFGHLLNSK